LDFSGALYFAENNVAVTSDQSLQTIFCSCLTFSQLKMTSLLFSFFFVETFLILPEFSTPRALLNKGKSERHQNRLFGCLFISAFRNDPIKAGEMLEAVKAVSSNFLLPPIIARTDKCQ
jgi:hypothetical protein